MDAKEMFLVVLCATRIPKTVFGNNQELMAVFIPKH